MYSVIRPLTRWISRAKRRFSRIACERSSSAVMVMGMYTYWICYFSTENLIFAIFHQNPIFSNKNILFLGSLPANCPKIPPYFCDSKIKSLNQAMRSSANRCHRCRWLHRYWCTSWPVYTLPSFFQVQPFIFSSLSRPSYWHYPWYGSQSLKAFQW